MEVTEQWWTLAGTGLLLVVLAVLTEQFFFLFAAGGVNAWLISGAVTASQSFTSQEENLSVDYTLSASEIFVERKTELTLHVSRPASTTKEYVEITAEMPPGITVETGTPTVTLQPGETEGTTTCLLSADIVGRFVFPAATVTIDDRHDLYSITIPRRETPILTVRPHNPTLHVGQGGTGVQSAYGQHQSDQPGPGVTTRELREYVPGDDSQQIDWNATARLGKPYVRETEGETDRRTLLLVDHRHRMTTGTNNETMLAYAREVAGGIAQTAAENGDPLGFWAIGDEGITAQIQAGTTPQTYTQIESKLYSLQPTADTVTLRTRSATQAQHLADRLTGDPSSFASVLRTYASDQTQYRQRFRADPLVNTVRQTHTEAGEDGLVVMVTSDSEPVKLREAVKTAIQAGSQTLVFITPQCLFEPTDMAELDDLYERYREFEEFRRELEQHPRVTAFEVAPETRIQRVLAHRRASATSRGSS